MRLVDLDRTDGAEFSRFVTRVREAGGAEEFELRIAGPGSGDAIIDLTIDSSQHKAPAESQPRQKM
jgi:hypothetical protein